jgi:hypothetical protein
MTTSTALHELFDSVGNCLSSEAAGIASLPEQSPHTSIKERVDNAVAHGRMEDVEPIRNGSVAAQSVSGDVEDALCWFRSKIANVMVPSGRVLWRGLR